VRSGALVAKTLPFYGPQRLIQDSISGHGQVAMPLIQTALYGVALHAVARPFLGSRLSVAHHAAGESAVTAVSDDLAAREAPRIQDERTDSGCSGHC
jgi:hypothetical protein